MGLPAVVEQAVAVTQRDRGYPDWEMLESFVLLIAGGGECVEDLTVLKADRGLVRLVGHDIPSPSAGKKYLYGFHDDEQAKADAQQRVLFPSYVPHESAALVVAARLGVGCDASVSGHQLAAPGRSPLQCRRSRT